MSHDTDKLIRQLSLVAFLMAERRPLTARDVKSNVEGYSEMSDEAFARRFYSDRAELVALGVPLQSQRDEFTGEELYTLRSEQYFLPSLVLSDEELAALFTALSLLDGNFAYAEPLRLGLQNLALGRPGFPETPSPTAASVLVRDPDYSQEMPGRLGKLESAISKQRTIKFLYRSISTGNESERTLNPYALLRDGTGWYVVGHDLDRKDMRTFRVSRIRSDIRFATRRERDYRIPADFNIEDFRGRAVWQLGDIRGEAALEVKDDTAWWVARTFGDSGRLEDGIFRTEYSSLGQLASWILRQDGRAVPIEPDGLRRAVAEALVRVREAHQGPPDELSPPSSRREHEPAAERQAGPVAPERFGVLQALLAHLLAACGEGRDATIDAHKLAEDFNIPFEALEEHLSLLNLVNFGGGCYAVYAELDGDFVHVDKELYGDTFRHPPRLTPLEARAIRLALEFVGPDDRREGAHPARPRAREARGDVRAVPARTGGRAPAFGGRDRGGHRLRPLARRERAPARRVRVPEGGRGRTVDAGSSSRTRSSATSRSGASTRGTARATGPARSGSTGSRARACWTRRSSRGPTTTPRRSAMRARRASATAAASRPGAPSSAGARRSCGTAAPSRS